MQYSNIPTKFLVPFAQNDSAKVEVPVTTATAGRASQSLGFPPITGQPPEAGGLPPQLEDFNGAINQIARVTWWAQLGGQWAFDSTFANDSNIGGYPSGAIVLSADRSGTWLSLDDNNTRNPDSDGTGWAPLSNYGVLVLSSVTGGTVTPIPYQAMRRRISISGALSSNLVVVLPNWVYSWDITNNTTGAFAVTVKTGAGAGVVIPQNGVPTPISGDGTNIVQTSSNIGPATTPTQAMQFGQAVGRLVASTLFTASGTWTANAATKSIRVRMVGGGGAGGSAFVNNNDFVSMGGGGGGGAFLEAYWTGGFGTTQPVTVGAGGTFSSLGGGNPGTASSFGSLATAPGGEGGQSNQVPATQAFGLAGQGSGGGLATTTGAAWATPSTGQAGRIGQSFGNIPIGGGGGSSPYGSGPQESFGTNGAIPVNGAGGGGASNGPNGAAVKTGGNGASGLVIIEEYA